MAKLLGLLLLAGLGWLVVQRLLSTKPVPSKRAPRFEKTVRCQRCGVHLPLKLATAEADGYICADPDCNQADDSDPGRRARR